MGETAGGNGVHRVKKSKKGARSNVAASERAVESGNACETAQPSATNHTISTSGSQMLHIADLLSHGPENGITLRHLEKLSDLPGREIRRKIERERRAGALIISDNQHGYYLTDNPAEAQRFARSMQHRAWEILRTARAIEGAAGLD